MLLLNFLLSLAFAADVVPLPDFMSIYRISQSVKCNGTFIKEQFTCLACSPVLKATKIAIAYQNNGTKAAGFIAVNEQLSTIYVSFRGTSSLRNMVADLNIWPNRIAFNDSIPAAARVHDGFYDAWMSLRDVFIPTVEDLSLQYPSYSILFIGISMGGALAQLAAVDLLIARPGLGCRISVVTFGQPKFGNLEMAQYIDHLPFGDRVYRVVKDNDPVPYTPLQIWGYYHTKDQYTLSIIRDGSMSINHCQLNVNQTGCLNNISQLRLHNHYRYFNISASCTPSPI